MCDEETNITLHESGTTEIIYCKCCKSFTLMHGTTCAAFNKAELRYFLEILDSLRAPAFQYHVAGEAKTMVMKPNANIGFCLSETEVSELMYGIRESLTLFEAFEIIYQ